jgi:fucose 4-O-acetylase-like acetyltransferase
MAALPAAWVWNASWTGRSPLQELGRASLLVYWVHVEMVYGVVSAPIHRGLTLERALAAFGVLALFLYAFAKILPRLLPQRLGDTLRQGGFLPAAR